MPTRRFCFQLPSIKVAFAAINAAALVQIVSAAGLITSSQDPNMGSTAISSKTASETITTSQVQGAPQPQGPLSTAFLNTSTAFDSVKISQSDGEVVAVAQSVTDLISVDAPQSHTGDVLVDASPSNDHTPASSSRTSVGVGGETTNHNAHFQSAQSVSNVADHPNTTAKPSITTTFSPLLDTETPKGLAFGTETITASSKSQHIFPSTDLLLPHATTAHTLSMVPSFLTTSGQTATADRLGQHSTDIQPLTKGSLITVSGTTLAPNESNINVGVSTEAFGPSVTAKLGSGPNGTDVQRFKGDALGARDGWWSSSVMLLASFVLLLWLR